MFEVAENGDITEITHAGVRDDSFSQLAEVLTAALSSKREENGEKNHRETERSSIIFKAVQILSGTKSHLSAKLPQNYFQVKAKKSF